MDYKLRKHFLVYQRVLTNFLENYRRTTHALYTNTASGRGELKKITHNQSWPSEIRGNKILDFATFGQQRHNDRK